MIERYADGAVLRNDEGRLPRVAGLLAELVLDDSVLDGTQLPVRLGKEVARAHAGSPMVMEATLSCSLARACLRFVAVLSPSASCSSSHSSSRKSGLRQRSMFSTLV